MFSCPKIEEAACPVGGGSWLDLDRSPTQLPPRRAARTHSRQSTAATSRRACCAWWWSRSGSPSPRWCPVKVPSPTAVCQTG